MAQTFDSAQRFATYEELWRTEEEALWTWLEDRVGMDEGLIFPKDIGRGNADTSREAQAARSRALNGQRQGKNRNMGEREVEWAIKVTEEKLKQLNHKVGNRKGNQSPSQGPIDTTGAAAESGR